MKAADMLPLLTRWFEIHDALEKTDDALYELTGRSPESPMFDAMWGSFGGYTEMLETVLIGSANSKWLEWYQFECQMGARSMSVQIKDGEEDTPIQTLADLATFLEACQ